MLKPAALGAAGFLLVCTRNELHDAILYSMPTNRVVEYTFFFGLMAVVGFLLWRMLAPFISSLALSGVIVTICYPLYLRIKKHTPKQNQSAAALMTTLLVLLIVILPLGLLISALLSEALSVYQLLGSSNTTIVEGLNSLESHLQTLFPSMQIDMTAYLRQSAQWFATNLGTIFASTAATIFSIFISLIGVFYFFRDGKSFTKELVRISPLPDSEDELILKRLSIAIRSVAVGTVLVAMIQGTLTAIGLSIFGFERAILLGTVAAVGALFPSVGTSIVFIPCVAYLLITGEYLNALGLTIWGSLAVGLIDNLLGPYLMSRGNVIHPFLILLSVLGGVAVFGPIGFIVGPVIVSFFKVLLELYTQHIAEPAKE